MPRLAARTRPSPRPLPNRRRQRRRRTVLLTVSAVAVIFAAILVLWAGGTIGGNDTQPNAGSRDATTPPASSGPSSGSSSGSADANGLPALPGLGSALANLSSTDLRSFGPGNHRVVLTAKSDEKMLAVAYSIKGGKQGHLYYNVASPVVIVRTLSGGRPYGAVALQMGPSSRYATCSVSIDGVVVDHRSYDKGYGVFGCVG